MDPPGRILPSLARISQLLDFEKDSLNINQPTKLLKDVLFLCGQLNSEGNTLRSGPP